MRLVVRWLIGMIGCLLPFVLGAQEADTTVVVPIDTLQPTKTKVFLEHANTLSFDKEVNAEAQVLVGEVIFRHDSSYM